MTKYERKMDYEVTWKHADPPLAVRDILSNSANLSVTLEQKTGNKVTWRPISRNENILTIIRESLHRMKNNYSIIGEEAQILYDKLEEEGYLNS